ncbi:hypothetical protein Y032_0053g2354 [Ancylostoma ceylanicum]|nr:hypothetical protein Y032_0053g2354 [Ancylostoma ceylanicum]
MEKVPIRCVDAFDEIDSTDSNRAPVKTAKHNTLLETSNDPVVRIDPTQYTETGISESLEERQTLLEELKTEYFNLLDKEKPDLIFVQVTSLTAAP